MERMSEDEFRALGDHPLDTRLGAVEAYGRAWDEARRARAAEEKLGRKLEVAKKALEVAAPHHQGGHSEVGRAIRAALDELEKP